VTAKSLRCLLVLTLGALSALALARRASAAEPEDAPAGAAAATDGASPDVASQKKLKTEKHVDDAPPPEAKPAEEPKKEDKESGEEDTFGHGFQFGLRAGVVFGYKMDFRYDKSPLCQKLDTTKADNDQQKICGFGSPAGTELALSFALLDSVEPYLFARFGFSGESKTDTKPLQLVGLGARIYTMSDSRLKIFIEPALAYETEAGYGSPGWKPNTYTPAYKKDLIFHVGVGPQYDFAKAFGVFVNGAIDVGVLRAISANLLLNIGVQLRFL
jgi:opacity protein-like surface antigen